MPIIVEPRLIPTLPLQIACPANMSRGALLGEHIETPEDLGGAAPSPQRRAAVAGARRGVHGRRAARRAIGLEACLVDNDTMRIAGTSRLLEAATDAEDGDRPGEPGDQP